MTFDPADLDTSVRADLLAAVRMVSIGTGQVLVDGVPVGAWPASTGAEEHLPARLAAALYSRWFAGWWPTAGTAQICAGTAEVVARLRAAHAATERFEDGWAARAVRPFGLVLAARNGQERFLQSGDYVNRSRPGVPVRIGDALGVTLRHDAGVPQDGWWLTWASAGPAPNHGMLRLYWNCGLHAVAPLVRAITTALENRGVAYTLKCPSSAALFGRCDGVVLYLGHQAWRDARGALRQVHEDVADQLRTRTPPLTLRLGRGVALAEDPGNGSSFGQTRARAVADGVLAVLAARLLDSRQVIDTLADRLEAHGIRPAWPYLKATTPPGAVSAW